MSSGILSLSSTREPAFDASLHDLPLSGPASKEASLSSTPFGGKLLWVGNATCIIEYEDIRFMTDPNFLHQGDHIHLAPGMTAQRVKDPAFDYEHCPAVDFILLSHLHEDHFDNLVADHIRKSLPIISNIGACENLKARGHTALYPLNTWEKLRIVKGSTEINITSMPGKHTLGSTDETISTILKLIPPVMGSMVEFSKKCASGEEPKTYNLYISGDTLFYDELKEIHVRYPHIQLALVHVGGTTLPGIRVMVTMDGTQGVQLICALQPERAVPIHIDDYDVFESPLSDFQEAVKKAGWEGRVSYLSRGDQFAF